MGVSSSVDAVLEEAAEVGVDEEEEERFSAAAVAAEGAEEPLTALSETEERFSLAAA